MATVRVAPQYHPKTEEILNSLGFKILIDHCTNCGHPVVVQVVLEGEAFAPVPIEDQFVCTECSKK